MPILTVGRAKTRLSTLVSKGHAGSFSHLQLMNSKERQCALGFQTAAITSVCDMEAHVPFGRSNQVDGREQTPSRTAEERKRQESPRTRSRQLRGEVERV